MDHFPIEKEAIFRRVRKIAKSDYQFRHICSSARLSVCLSLCMEQLGSHWADFPEILYLRIFRKSVMNIQVSLKSEKTKGYFT